MTMQEDHRSKKGKKRKKDKVEVSSFLRHHHHLREEIKMFFLHTIFTFIAFYSTVFHYINACLHFVKNALLRCFVSPSAHLSHDATAQRSITTKMKRIPRDNV